MASSVIKRPRGRNSVGMLVLEEAGIGYKCVADAPAYQMVGPGCWSGPPGASPGRVGSLSLLERVGRESRLRSLLAPKTSVLGQESPV